jgi:hypothetical protein
MLAYLWTRRSGGTSPDSLFTALFPPIAVTDEANGAQIGNQASSASGSRPAMTCSSPRVVELERSLRSTAYGHGD